MVTLSLDFDNSDPISTNLDPGTVEMWHGTQGVGGLCIDWEEEEDDDDDWMGVALAGVRWFVVIVRRLWEVKLHGMLLPVLMRKSGVSALKVRWVRFHSHVHVAFLSVLVFVFLVHLAAFVLQKRR